MLKRLKIKQLFWAILAVKISALVLFSSDYQTKLFVPFIEHYLSHFDNPWQYFYLHPEEGVEFPYSAGMLFILSIFYAPAHWLGMDSSFIQNIFFKLPTLGADILIYVLLGKMFFDRRKVIIYYFATPIIIYACYMHSQIDLIPTAFLFLSVYLLTRRRIILSSIVLGLAVATKLHVAAAFPLMAVYLWKRRRMDCVPLMVFAPGTYVLMTGIFFSEGFNFLVLNNPKQMLVYDVFLNMGTLKVYLPVLLVLILYARYSAFRRINHDLLYTFMALIFSAFVALTIPAPGWYVWLFPYLSIFFIKFHDRKPDVLKLFVGLNVLYLVYIVFFYLPEYRDLTFLGHEVDWKIRVEKWRNLSFTFLEAAIVACLYAFYKFGIKSNVYYRKNSPTVIGISGDSAAGKSTLLTDIKNLFGSRVLELEGDADHKWERDDPKWQELTHLNPKANYLHRQYEDIINLQYGRRVFRSDYDHATGRFASRRRIQADDYIVLSGLHAFYLPKMRKITDLKIYVDTDEKLRRHWKSIRDMRERGKSREDVLRQIEQRMEDARRYIHPQHDFADMVVRYFTDDDFKIGDEKAIFKVGLTVIIDSSVPVHLIISQLEEKVGINWDYSQDLKTQSLTINGDLSSEFIAQLAKHVIINAEDLLGEEPKWSGGYRGFVQLLIVWVLSEKIKTFTTENDNDEI
jgi:uridine kinase